MQKVLSIGENAALPLAGPCARLTLRPGMDVNRPRGEARTRGSRGAAELRDARHERQPAQLRLVGHHRPVAACIVHAVPEPGPAHAIDRNLVLAALDPGRPGPGAR